MRILIATFGSLGDLFPYLNIAKCLAESGHSVTIAANEHYRERTEAAGLEFRSLRPHLVFDPKIANRIMGEFDGGRYLLRRLMFPAVRDSYEDLKKALPSHDLLVSHILIFAASLLARETGIRWISTVLAPMSFFSQSDPPVVNTLLKGMRPGILKLLNQGAQSSTRKWSAPFHALREELGQLSTGNPLFEGQHSPYRVLALFSRHFAAPQNDWPQQTAVTGFPLASPATLPPEIERFLAAGPPPIVFTLGSSAVSTPGKFFEAARSLGLRILLLSGQNAIPATPNLLAVDYAPHSAVFPHAAAIVHQGGIGTASEVLRSGRPSLVVPFAFDQPDNAARMERLGVARVISRRGVTKQRLKRGLDALLGNASYAKAAARLGREINAENGARSAAQAMTSSVDYSIT